jgi:hypothetical protein
MTDIMDRIGVMIENKLIIFQRVCVLLQTG